MSHPLTPRLPFRKRVFKGPLCWNEVALGESLSKFNPLLKALIKLVFFTASERSHHGAACSRRRRHREFILFSKCGGRTRGGCLQCMTPICPIRGFTKISPQLSMCISLCEVDGTLIIQLCRATPTAKLGFFFFLMWGLRLQRWQLLTSSDFHHAFGHAHPLISPSAAHEIKSILNSTCWESLLSWFD